MTGLVDFIFGVSVVDGEIEDGLVSPGQLG
jgi:hypothetical protein